MEAVRVGPEVIYRSAAFHDVVTRIRRLAKFDVPVLIHGETGTGKEVLARLLHYSGKRSAGPFVPVNAGAIVDLLVEAELFGHEPGAFTDARTSKKGLVELADRGSLFLDEIDALGGHGQGALLRFLQDGRFRPVGSTRELSADVRIIAATNAVPEDLLAARALRKDLYYRIAGVTVEILPLRERRDDILPLASHFLDELKAQWPERGPCSLGTEMRGWLMARSWPGNARELRSAIEQSFIMGDGELLMPLDQGEPCDRPALACFRDAKAETLKAFEQNYLEQVMRDASGNVSQAARASGKERKDFDRLLRKHGVDRRAFRPER